MNFNQLEYFSELISQGNFTLAAEKLGISQPALSLQIQKLEEEVDFKLINRNKKPLELTREGKIFYQKALEILNLARQLNEITLELSEEITGTLKTGIIPTLAPYLVPLFIDRLNTLYPSLLLEVSELKTEEIINGIKTGKLDCGLLSTPVIATGISFFPLFYEKFFAYISEGHPLFFEEEIDPAAFKNDDLWYLEEGNCFRNQVDAICRANNKTPGVQNLVYHSNSIESLRRIVENKKGATFIPELATINVPPEQEELIKELKGEPPAREISLAFSKTGTKERLIRALEKIILDSIPKRMHQKPEAWIIDTEIDLTRKKAE